MGIGPYKVVRILHRRRGDDLHPSRLRRVTFPPGEGFGGAMCAITPRNAKRRTEGQAHYFGSRFQSLRRSRSITTRISRQYSSAAIPPPENRKITTTATETPPAR